MTLATSTFGDGGRSLKADTDGRDPLSISSDVKSSLSLLIVDDDPVIVELITDALSIEGYVVRRVFNGVEGLMAIAAEPRPVISAGWKYGYGSFDPEMNRVRDFQPMMTRHEERMIPGEKFPSPDHGHLSLTATGGHPGRAAGGASIRRWTAPAVGKVKIEGTLGHANASGDGVRDSSRRNAPVPTRATSSNAMFRAPNRPRPRVMDSA